MLDCQLASESHLARTASGCELVSMLTSHVVIGDSVKPKTIDYEIGISCFSAKHAALRNNTKNWFGFMVFNTTFNNISVISWQPVLLVEESRKPGENHRPAASH